MSKCNCGIPECKVLATPYDQLAGTEWVAALFWSMVIASMILYVVCGG